MIETSLVYIFSIEPSRAFLGCGAVVEGGYVATCRHVWRDAGEPTEVEIEFPFVRENGVVVKQAAELADSCEGSGDPAPDVVFAEAGRDPKRRHGLAARSA